MASEPSQGSSPGDSAELHDELQPLLVNATPLDRNMHIEVAFRGLGLRVRRTGSVVLRGLTGRLRAGRTVAVMGPSGSGTHNRQSK